MLEIKNLHAEIDGKSVLKGVDLTILPGEVHAIMGPNGAGKSTLAKILAGHPSYTITEGEISFCGQNILEMAPEERAHLGIFLSFQYPPEIKGVSLSQFLYEVYKAKTKSTITEEEFSPILDEKMALLEIPAHFKTRDLNDGFSGGEKKRSEILQMAVLEPLLGILDETDSGLDIDAMKIVARSVLKVKREKSSLLVITHYQRLLNYLKPDIVHIFMNGKIITSGGADLALKLEEKGYELCTPF
jgi:Fe-S cluster assembly ATP-binding protein